MQRDALAAPLGQLMFGQLLGKAQVGQLVGLGLGEQFLELAGGSL